MINNTDHTPTERAGKLTSEVALHLMTCLEEIHSLIVKTVGLTLPLADEAKKILSEEKQPSVARQHQQSNN